MLVALPLSKKKLPRRLHNRSRVGVFVSLVMLT